MLGKGQKRLCYRASCARYPSVPGCQQAQRVVPGLHRVDIGLFPLRYCCGRQSYGSGRALAESYYRQTLSLLFWWLVIRRLRAFLIFWKRMLMGEPS